MIAKLGAVIATGVLFLSGVGGQEVRTADPAPSLVPLLDSARKYCAKLERAALDFICMEEVEERLDLSRDDRESLEQRARAAAIRDPGTQTDTRSRFVVRRNPRQKNTYLYDYQFVRRDGKTEEKRVLLEKNGRKASPQADSPRLGAFNYSDVLLAPIRLLDESFQAFYSYRLLGPDSVSGTDAWILEVVPRVKGVARYLGGRIWLKRGDASVLRIEWDPATFGHYEEIIARAESYGANPEVRSVTDFGLEKNGIRFPSSDLTEEAYREAGGKLFVRARTNIIYKDYKFFSVETSSTFKK